MVKARFTLRGLLARGDKIRWVTTIEAHLAKLMARSSDLAPTYKPCLVPEKHCFLAVFRAFSSFLGIFALPGRHLHFRCPKWPFLTLF